MIESGQMTEFGLKEIEKAKKNGTWNSPGGKPDEKGTVKKLEAALEEYPGLLGKCRKYPPSARKTLTFYYADAKNQESKKRRLVQIAQALWDNKKSVM